MTRVFVLFLLMLWITPAVAAPGDKIGPSISDELADAGLMGLPFSWRPSDGTVRTDDPRLTEAQRQKIREVFAAHDPTKLSRGQQTEQAKAQAKAAVVEQCKAIEADTIIDRKVQALCAALRGSMP